jgi:hypothetical protein
LHDALWRRFEHVAAIDVSQSVRSPRYLPPDLSPLTDLDSAILADDRSTGEGWQSLAMAPSLRTLRLHFGWNVDPKACVWLLRCERLEHLTCYGTVGDEGMKLIGGLHNLRDLDILDCRTATDTGFEALEGLQNLETLLVGSPNMSDRGLKSVTLLPHLKMLRILAVPGALPSALKITDEGLRSLGRLRELEDCFVDTDARGFDLGRIGEMPRLTYLYIYSPAFSDDSLPELMKIRKGNRNVRRVPGMSQAARERLTQAGWHVVD